VAAAIKDLWQSTCPGCSPTSSAARWPSRPATTFPSRSTRPSSTTPSSASTRPPGASGCCAPSASRNPTNTFTNPQIHAAILALGHSFIVQNYDEGAQLGTITVNGVIAQKWRGPVGTSGGTGYLKGYGYDSRMQYASPPYVQEITETDYRTSQWAEVTNPSGLPA
jgi:hypothetical protein